MSPEQRFASVPFERPRQPELTELYRPLDSEDWPWMGQLGLRRPVEGADEQKLLDELNVLMVDGSRRQLRRPDEGSEIVYEAREQFIAKFPALTRLHKQAQRSDSAYRRPIPTKTLVGTQRLLYGHGVDLADITSSNLVTVNPEAAIESMNSLMQHGINALEAIRIDAGFIGLGPKNLSEKIRVAYSLARAWGWRRETYKDDVNHILELDPVVLHYSAHHLRVLGRISTALSFEQRDPTEASSDIHRLVTASLSKVVAAYLHYGTDTTNPSSLVRRARGLELFRPEELRGYIAQFPNDPVVRSYLRGYPIKDDERLYGLGTLSVERRTAGWEPDAPYGPDGFMVAQKAANFRQFVRSLGRMQELEPDTEDRLFADVARGQEAAESLSLARQLQELAPGPLAQDEVANLEELWAVGQQAQKRITASYAARVIKEITKAPKHDAADKFYRSIRDQAQDDLHRLIVAIDEFARRPEDKRPDFWSYAKQRIRELRDEDLLTGEP